MAAAQAGMGVLRDGRDALAAASAAVVVMENDGRFNAGSGAILGLDGMTIEMDAGVMDTGGRLGAVACLQRVKNPVLVALAVADTPHWLLTGEGAERFARVAGFAPYYRVSARARQSHQELIAQLHGADAALPGVANDAFEKYWNYQTPWRKSGPVQGGDTVGAVARDADGEFAAATSTGGSAPSLLGRVGDTPIIGCGFHAGPAGAVAATGLGEHIVRHLLSYTVYRWIDEGVPLAQALGRGIDLFPQEIAVGLIAVNHTEAGSCSNRSMPVTIIEDSG